MLASFGVSDAGPVRSNNEDCFLADDRLSLYVVADGMGGHAAGEVASRLAVDAIEGFIRSAGDPAEFATACGIDPELSYAGNRLRTAICLANRRVFEMAGANPEYAGMGTTVVCALLTGTTLTIGHVGDSRLYILAGGRLVAQTRDDTWAAALQEGGEEATALNGHPMRNVLTNVLGARDGTYVHVCEREVAPGETLLLCTDGVHGAMADGRLRQLMSEAASAEQLAHAVVSAAIEHGSRDNVTAVVVQCLGAVAS
jgi:protein phosphatase